MTPPPETPRSILAAAAVLITAVYAFAFIETPAQSDVERGICLLRTGTGVPCPLCGMSRAFVRASHGDLTGAFRMHPLFPIAYLGGLVFLTAVVGGIAGSKRINTARFGSPLRLVVVCAAVFGLFWVARLAWIWHTGELGAAFFSSPAGRLLAR